MKPLAHLDLALCRQGDDRTLSYVSNTGVKICRLITYRLFGLKEHALPNAITLDIWSDQVDGAIPITFFTPPEWDGTIAWLPTHDVDVIDLPIQEQLDCPLVVGGGSGGLFFAFEGFMLILFPQLRSGDHDISVKVWISIGEATDE